MSSRMLPSENQDLEDLARIHLLLEDTLPSLKIQASNGAYPYEVEDGKVPPQPTFSMGTTAMVTHAVAAVTGRLHKSQLVYCPTDMTEDTGVDLDSQLVNAVGAIVARIAEGQTAATEATVSVTSPDLRSHGRPMGPFDSGTFGHEDPFTLCWVVEILAATERSHLANVTNRTFALSKARLSEAVDRRLERTFADVSRPVLEPLREHERAVLHPLPLLRALHLAEAIGSPLAGATPALGDFFIDRLHMQLAYRNIEHGGFDVSVMTFCLEGALIAAPVRVTRPIVDGFLKALDEYRRLDPTLRGSTPFKATASGAVHLFASVEVVASLLRSAQRLDRPGAPRLLGQLKACLHDYLLWLQATVHNGQIGTLAPDQAVWPKDLSHYVGWQSEHAHVDDRRIHLWLTSQLLEFLAAYRFQLQREIAERALTEVGLGPLKATGPGRVFATLQQRAQADRESASVLCQTVAPRIADDFVVPRLEADSRRGLYSAVLYGPPGTGKTTLVRTVAETLGWPLLSMTTSDFIDDGEARVEARASRLFDALMLQDRTVVLFEHIDRLVSARDRRFVGLPTDSDLLQFMTSSMLAKLHELRSRQRVIFFITSNYVERLDPAILRPGRVDESILVLPPDLSARTTILTTAAERYDLAGLAKDDVVAIARRLYFAGPAELDAVARRARSMSISLAASAIHYSPVVSISTYRDRLSTVYSASGGNLSACRGLLREVFMLTHLAIESNHGVAPSACAWVRDYWYASARELGLARDVEEVVSRGLSHLGDPNE